MIGKPALPGQVVLVLQGGGALGAYQVGVYEALHEAGIEPDWVIGTSIGAINAALISGNRPEDRLARLEEFWHRVEQQWPVTGLFDWLGLGNWLPNFNTVARGIPAFFTPNLAGDRRHARPRWASRRRRTTAPRRCARRCNDLVDFDVPVRVQDTRSRWARSTPAAASMRYFDNRKEPLDVEHVMASGALPPAFGAIRIDGEPYWDGGIYSNTPIEAVLDDKPRRDSLIFAVNVWHQTGARAGIDLAGDGPAEGHPVRQPRRQPHRAPEADPPPAPRDPRAAQSRSRAAGRTTPKVKELASWGCGTTMHVAHLLGAARRRRGPHQGHRLHAAPASARAAGRLRRHDAHDRALAVEDGSRRPDGRRDRARVSRVLLNRDP